MFIKVIILKLHFFNDVHPSKTESSTSSDWGIDIVSNAEQLQKAEFSILFTERVISFSFKEEQELKANSPIFARDADNETLFNEIQSLKAAAFNSITES